MKKIYTLIITAVLALSTAITVQASPADPAPYKYTQPDGSVITLRVHGDEFYSWITDEAGNEVKKGEDGFYHIVSNPLSPEAKSAAAEVLRTPLNISESGLTGPQSSISIGEHKFLVLLIEFSDVFFTYSNDDFSQMLNKQGYDKGTSIGSARDYFMDNSVNAKGESQFTPVFDVVGPIRVDKARKYYGAPSTNLVGSSTNDAHVGLLLLEACRKLDSQGFDFSKYDEDGDGYLDNMFFYFAGGGQAEHAGEDTIWPNKWDMLSYWYYTEDHSYPYYYNTHKEEFTFDGKRLYGYACSNELKGSSGSTMCGIGTFCHEFSHTLGLPDYYDTDYEINGEGDGLFEFSVMSYGNYKDDGYIPPYYSAMDRVRLGWMESLPKLRDGNYTLFGVQNAEAYMTPLSSNKEYFIYEARNGEKWDTGLPTGLLIYHIDLVQFEDKDLGNTYKSHPGIYFKAAWPATAYPNAPSVSGIKYIPYPGLNNVTSFDSNSKSPALDWNGNYYGDRLSNISYSNKKVTFTYSNVFNDDMYKKGYDGMDLDPEAIYPVNKAITLKMAGSADEVKSVKYYLDNVESGNSTVTPTKTGDHEIKAVVSYESGKTETIIQIIKVQ